MNWYDQIKHDIFDVHFIETEPSLFREVPGIRSKEHKVCWIEFMPCN